MLFFLYVVLCVLDVPVCFGSWGENVSDIVEGVWSDVEHWKDIKSPRIWRGVNASSTGGLAAASAEVRVVGRRWTLW